MSIQIFEIIEAKGLDLGEVSGLLFPGNAYPKLALKRVIKGESFLDSEQILTFAKFTGISIEELFTDTWKAETSYPLHVFTNGEFKAQLNVETWVTEIFYKGEVTGKTLLHSGSILLKDYLEKINEVIADCKA